MSDDPDNRATGNWAPLASAAAVVVLVVATAVVAVLARGDDGAADGSGAVGDVALVDPVRDPCPSGAEVDAAAPTPVKVGADRVYMCGAVYTGEAGDLLPPRELLTVGVEEFVESLRTAPESDSFDCTLVGGVEPYEVVIHYPDDSVAVALQGQCSGFVLGGDAHDGSLGRLLADAYRAQREVTTPPPGLDAAPGCEQPAAGDTAQSLLGEPADIAAATLCVIHDEDGVETVVDEVDVPTDALRTMLEDLGESGTDPADGFSLDTGCGDETIVDLVGTTVWGDLVTLHAPFCRDFYNQDVVWSPGPEVDQLLDELLGPDTAA